MPNTATRLITLILLLQRQPNQKAPDLAGELGVSVRSLHRYIGMLDEMGIPLYSERGRHGGFSLVRGYRIPPLVFTPQEATALYLGASLVETMWGRLYREAAHSALAKLDNVLPDEQRRESAWAQRSLVAAGVHHVDLERLTPLLEDLRRAIREGRSLTLHYRSQGQTAAPRLIDPYALVHRWGWWYCLGYCHPRQAIRSFRLDRIEAHSATGQRFELPAGFDANDYLGLTMPAPNPVVARLRFEPALASAALDNRAYWLTCAPQPDGSVEVTYASPDVRWAASTALAYGPSVEVVEPAELRQLVAEWALATANRYDPAARESAQIRNASVSP